MGMVITFSKGKQWKVSVAGRVLYGRGGAVLGVGG